MTYIDTKMIERLANTAMLIGTTCIVLAAFLMQLLFQELPCPLCLLQRIGFGFMALGFLMNLRFGFRPSHYSIVILGGIFTALVALRQISLHILPNTGAYGSAIFGLHLYTWSFIISIAILVSTSLILALDHPASEAEPTNGDWVYVTYMLFVFVAIVMAVNLVSVFLECGLTMCPDNPTQYLY